MNEAYYVVIDDQQAGPYTVDQLREMLAAGSISDGTLCWTQGQAEWQPVAQLGLRQGAPSPAVPVQPPPGQPPRYNPAAAVSRPATVAPPKTSGLAIWSFVLGLLMFVFSIFTAIPAVICGHISLGKIKESAGSLTGRGFAITGLVLGYLGLSIFPIAILAAIALPAFTAVQTKALEARSLNDGKMLGFACKSYAVDNQGSFPPSLEALYPKYVTDRKEFVSPLMPSDPDGYKYTSGLKDTDPVDTVLLEDKYGSTKHVRIVVHVDDSAQVIRTP